MKAIFVVLVTVLLTSPLSAVPVASPTSTPAKNETLPQEPGNLTRTDDDNFLSSIVVKYNQAEMENLAAQYDAAISGTSPEDTIAKVAESTGILPFCVGVKADPIRTRVFKNSVNCDSDGWYTHFVFTAHTKKDDYLAVDPVCAGSNPDGNHSMLFPKQETCSAGAWKEDFTFYESTSGNTGVHMWNASSPSRMLLYPSSLKHGKEWQQGENLQYLTQFRPAFDDEWATLKSEFSNHLTVHKNVTIASPSNATTLRCATSLIESLVYPLLRAGNENTYAEVDSTSASKTECSQLLDSPTPFVNRTTDDSNFGSIGFMIGNIPIAAITMKFDLEARAEYLRTALHESLRTGLPVMVVSNPAFLKDSIVAYVQKTAVVIGDPTRIFNDIRE